MKFDEAKKLKYGEIIHHISEKNADGTPLRLRVNGAPKTWKRDPERLAIPVKYGMYGYGYLTNGTHEGRGFCFPIDDVEKGDGR